jgi:type IV secretory pathway TrbL component
VVAVAVEVVGAVVVVVGAVDVLVVVVVVLAGVVVVVGGGALVTEGAVVVAGTGTWADVGAEDEVPQPAAASAVRTSRASRVRRRRTPETVSQSPAAGAGRGAYLAASIERHRSSMGW